MNTKLPNNPRQGSVVATDWKRCDPYQLSGGQMQRVAIARALVHSPGVVIADEPTGNLDTASGEQVLALLKESAERLGATVLMATHSAEAAAIASVRVHLRDGRIEGVALTEPRPLGSGCIQIR